MAGIGFCGYAISLFITGLSGAFLRGELKTTDGS